MTSAAKGWLLGFLLESLALVLSGQFGLLAATNFLFWLNVQLLILSLLMLALSFFRRSLPRTALGIIVTLGLGEFLIALGALGGSEESVLTVLGQCVWILNRLLILMFAVALLSKHRPRRPSTVVVLAASVALLIPMSVIVTALPLWRSGELVTGTLGLLGGVGLALLLPQFLHTAQSRNWLTGGVALYLITEQVLYSLETTPSLETFPVLEFGYFLAYGVLIFGASVMSTSPNSPDPTDHKGEGSRSP